MGLFPCKEQKMSRFKITRQDKPIRKSQIAKPTFKKIETSKKVGHITSGSDITMCGGGDCPFKTMCHRHTAMPDTYQSYFSFPPFKIKKGKPSCEMFWGDVTQQLFVQLKSIFSGEKKQKK